MSKPQTKREIEQQAKLERIRLKQEADAKAEAEAQNEEYEEESEEETDYVEEEKIESEDVTHDLEEFSCLVINDEEALALSNQHDISHIKFSTCYNMDPREETRQLMKMIINYCQTQKKSGAILAKMAGYANDLNRKPMKHTDLDSLIKVPYSIRKQACGMKPITNVTFLHEYNILDVMFELGHHNLEIDIGKISIIIDDISYTMTNQDNYWCMDEETGKSVAKICGPKYLWVSKGITTHMLFAYLQIARVSVVLGKFEFDRIGIDTSPTFTTLPHKEQIASLNLRSHIYGKVERLIDRVKNVPSVSNINDTLSVLIHSVPKNDVVAKEVLNAIKSATIFYPKPINIAKNAYDFLNAARKVKSEENKVLMEGVKTHSAVAYLDSSRSFRGGDNSVHNTYLKDVCDIGPPLPRISTFCKWQATVDDMVITETDKIAMIGCTSANDWWSGCTGLDKSQVIKYDKKPIDDVVLLDITAPQAQIQACDIVLSDVFVHYEKVTEQKHGDKKKEKGDTDSIGKMNAQKMVPSQIINLATAAGAKLIAIKCFPAKDNDGNWSLDHLGTKDLKGWYFNIFINGRGHNMEFIYVLTRVKNIVSSTIATTISKPDLDNILFYIMGYSLRCNVYRNTLVRTLCPVWNVIPACSLDNLPKGRRILEPGEVRLESIIVGEFGGEVNWKKEIKRKKTLHGKSSTSSMTGQEDCVEEELGIKELHNNVDSDTERKSTLLPNSGNKGPTRIEKTKKAKKAKETNTNVS